MNGISSADSSVGEMIYLDFCSCEGQEATNKQKRCTVEMHSDLFGLEEDLQKGVCNQKQTERLFVEVIEMECSERDEREA